MRTHPLWNPYDPPSEEEINAARALVGVWTPAPVEVVAPYPTWPQAYAVVRDQIVAALGERVLTLEHVGSTAVLGLWAKPMIDVDLTADVLVPGRVPDRAPRRSLRHTTRTRQDDASTQNSLPSGSAITTQPTSP